MTCSGMIRAAALAALASMLAPPGAPWAAGAAPGDQEAGGRVLDAVSGAPVEGANVATGRASAVTDARGRFRVAAGPGDSLTVSHVGYATGRHPALPALVIRLQPRALPEAEVVVRAGLVQQALGAVPASLSVRDSAQVAGTHGGHLEALAGDIPNLNWAGGTSRPRYFQIRGMGERSHYAGEGPPNSAVGFVLDDVDLSGMGSVGLLYDLEQVEVFRGPQSTVFGPNCMAGLISLQSTAPAATFTRQAALTVGSDALLRASASADLPVHRQLAVRLGYAAARENGYRTNEYLERDDTNGRDETMARLKARWDGPGGLACSATLFRAALANGYDAWAPDNNEALRTYTDRPGVDSQRTTGLSLRSLLPLGGRVGLVAITAYARTAAEYSYDGDWGNDAYWAGQPYAFDPAAEGWRYDFRDRTRRHREVFTQEARLVTGRTVVGAYGKSLRESDRADGYLFGGDATDLASTFDVTDLALYTQWDAALGSAADLLLNARLDRNGTAYTGRTNGGAERVAFDVADWLPSGRAAVTWHPAPAQSTYAAVSRGYLAGGVNQHPYLAADRRRFRPEYVTNLELGYRRFGQRHASSAVLFHTLRRDQQVDLSSQQRPGDPNSFVYYIANAASGTASGLELEQRLRLTPAVRLAATLGLLRTRVAEYSSWTGVGQQETLGDRAAAHAPSYTFSVTGDLGRRHGPGARLELTGMDGFYYSQSQNHRAAAHQLVHAQLGYQGTDWSVTLWSRNLLDARYAVRGFFFGLEPPDFPDRLYVTYGDPRQVGLTVTAQL